MHIDDGMTFSNDTSLLSDFKAKLQQNYKVKWDINPSLHLRVHITSDRKLCTITLDQRHYCKNMLDHFNMSDCNRIKTPLPQNVHLFTPEVEDSVEIETYYAAVGMLNFLAIQTQPDISFSVSYLACFNSCHNKSHWLAVKNLLHFFKGTINTGLTFGEHKAQNRTVEGYANSDYAGDVETRRSITGFIFYVKG